MKRFILYILPLFLVFGCQTDESGETAKKESFIRFFGSSFLDEGFQIAQAEDDGYLVAGIIEDENEFSDIILLKTNAYGELQWQNQLGDSLNDYGTSFCLTEDGSAVVAGSITLSPANNTNVFVAKVNTSGQTVWSYNFGNNSNQRISDIIETTDGGFLLAGTTDAQNTQTGNPAGQSDVFYMKISAQGDSLWSKVFGGPNMDVLNAISRSHQDGYMLFGSTSSFSGPGQATTNMYVLEINENGGTVASRTFGSSMEEEGIDVFKTNDGYIFTGSTMLTNSGESDIFVVKTTTQIFETEWENSYGGTQTEFSNSVFQLEDGTFAIAGLTDSYGEGSNDAYLILVNTAGNLIMEKTFGGSASEWANGLIETSDGGFAITGAAEYNENRMITLIKVNQNLE